MNHFIDNERNKDHGRRVGRRAFLHNGTLVLGAATMASSTASAADPKSAFSIGMVTDLHYANKDPRGTRHYRETLGKIDEAAALFAKKKPDFVVELGDLIDAADSVATEQRYLKTIQSKFAAICDQRHYVLGNHCVDTLTKEEFLGGVGQEKSFYAFTQNGFRFIVLDACFRSDGKPYQRKNFKWTDANVPPHELEWLQAELASSPQKTIVFAHQRLDVANNHGVKNNVKVRGILEAAGCVLAVFQGHSHHNDLREIGGIHYCTLAAMVEGSGAQSNGYSLMQIATNGSLRIEGFRRQSDYDWPNAG